MVLRRKAQPASVSEGAEEINETTAIETDPIAELKKDDDGPITPSSPSEKGIEEKTSHELEIDEAQAGLRELDGSEGVTKISDQVIRDGADVSRIAVSTRDDGDPALTFRSVVLGSVLAAFSSVVTVFYLFKPVQISISTVFLQLVAYVLGLGWAKLTPSAERLERVSPRLGAVARFFNLGQPFGLKEHVVATLIGSCANNSLAGVEVAIVQRLFYPQSSLDTTTVLFGLFSISIIGFVIAGVLRPLIVYPAEMVYWTQLPQISLMQSLHYDVAKNKKRLTRFGQVLLGSTIYELFPAYLFPTLNGISIPCFPSARYSSAARDVATNIFGGANSNEGLGLLNFSLDWQYITSSALSLPLKQQANSWIGLALMWLIMPLLYYRNAFGSRAAQLPMLGTSLYAEDGSKYNLTAVFGHSLTINNTALAEQGLPVLTSSTLWGYISANLAVAALISHVLLFYGGDMWKALKQARAGTQPDPHYQAMKKYKEVPMWWYGIAFVLAFFAGLISVLHGQTMPWWAYLVSLLLGARRHFLDPLDSDSIGTNTLSKMVGGVLVPGRPLAGLWFASFSHQVILLAVNLASGLKFGQYTKIPWRTLFASQAYGTLLGLLVNYLIAVQVAVSKREVLLNDEDSNVWSVAMFSNLNSQAVTWSIADRVYSYSRGAGYWLVPFALLIGFIIPFIHFIVQRRYKFLEKYEVNAPIILQYMGGYNYFGAFSYLTSTVAIGAAAQLWLRRRHPKLFNKYMYIVGSALDGGSQITLFILSFAVYGAAGPARAFPTWWGNPDGNVDHCNPPE
ncbi:peptide transporter mtd1 [Ceraceosorus bombacis]|uniref:Peptide transporter mtd1 n=1 Tax=Ceraceosorus bombacis TaxID=401625 RepID=A0A0P1BG29_9BASI|nr:peptide transporter mtd1 [Ceraceosorus bombacis]